MRSDINNGIVAGSRERGRLWDHDADDERSDPRRGQMPMMAMVAKVVRSDSMTIGWLYHLFNSAVIGAIFGWLLGNRSQRIGEGLGWGAAYGFVWWILGGLILMPLFLGMSPFAPLQMAPMRPVAMGSLTGHLIYGLILGGGFAMLKQGIPGLTPQHKPHQR